MEKERIKEMDSVLKSSADENNAEESEKIRESENEAKKTPEDGKSGKDSGKENADSQKGNKDDSLDSEEEKRENDEFGKKDRWYGKSREEVIRMYEEFEKKNPLPDNRSEVRTPASKEDKKGAIKENGEFQIPSDEEFSGMTPKQFASWVMDNVKNIVGSTYDARSRMRESVSQEIREAQKDHPLLKASSEYRELVLALIEAASQKGAVMSLKEACEKVDLFAGKAQGEEKVSDEEKTRLKKAKAQVERGSGAPAVPSEEKSGEERRLENIFGTNRLKSPFGGLGA